MIIVSCSVVIRSGGKILFIKEIKSVAAGKYGLPGGKLELGETLMECAARECLEETGLQVAMGPLIAITHKPMSHEKNSVVRFIFMAENDVQMNTRGELEYYWLDETTFSRLAKENQIRGMDVVDVVSGVFQGTAKELPLPDLYYHK
mgnify:CR=1 FL=1